MVDRGMGRWSRFDVAVLIILLVGAAIAISTGSGRTTFEGPQGE